MKRTPGLTRVSLAGLALLTASIGALAVAAPATADVQPGATLSVKPGVLADGKPADSLAAFQRTIAVPVATTSLICPEPAGLEVQAGAFLAEQGSEGWPASKLPWEANIAATLGGSGIIEDGSVDNPTQPISDAYFDASARQATLTDFVQAGHSYSLGLYCFDATNFTTFPGADGNAIVTFGTLTIDSTGTKWSFSAPKVASTTTLTGAVKAGAVTLTAKVPFDASGTVDFFEGDAKVGSGTIAAGQATATVTGASIGSHTYTATYTGSDAYTASTSTALVIDVPKAATTVNLAAAASGDTGATLTATVVADTVTATSATGTVDFMQGTTKLGTGTVANGVATYTAAGLTPGATVEFTASYGGDAKFGASAASAAASFTVPAAPIELTEGATAKPDVRYYVDAPAGTFTAGEKITGVVTSDPITLSETATAAADGSARYVFTLPAALFASTDAAHTLTLTGATSANSFARAFVIVPAAVTPTPSATPGANTPDGTNPGTTGSGTGTNVNGLANTGAAQLPLMLGGLAALIAGLAAVVASRILRTRKRAAGIHRTSRH
ncbi:Ig-like domain-containing protein [Okibacterium fritillariae]|uniref:Ig-like domain-containing protein n=1 Tax=Okibacterium fritillariae TaxID=123320 RepID=UPI004055688C